MSIPTFARYADLQALLDYLSPSGALGSYNDGLLQDSLDEAESAINDYTHRQFAGTAGTYYINRYQTHLVQRQAMYLQQDLHTLISLTNGDSTNIPVGSVWLEPRNSGPPFRLLRLKSPYVYVWNTDSDVIVAGTFGFSTVPPAAISRACVELAAYYFRIKDVGPTDVAGVSAAGEVAFPKDMPDYIKGKLNPYKPKTGGRV
jgi:hypothetical protein